MDAAAKSEIHYRRLLPYWAVLQTDLRQTVRSWVYVIWVAVSVWPQPATCSTFRPPERGGHRSEGQHPLRRPTEVAGAWQPVVDRRADGFQHFLRTRNAGGFRAVARHQPAPVLPGKWHSRMLVVMATYTVLFTAIFFGSCMLFNDDLT